MSNILEVKGLCKSFTGFSLKDVSFSIPEGFVMGFIGPNGAGKTTTIKSILGMLNIDAGDITVMGAHYKDHAAEIKEQIGVVMDLPFYADDWNIKDVESALAPFYRQWNHEKYEGLLQKFGIAMDKKVKELSRGMKVKLMVSAALSHEARLLILDEPTSGLDPVARDDLLDILGDFMTDEKKGVLFSTHITSDLEKIADYITYIRDGRIEFTGLKDDLLQNYLMIKGGPTDITADQKKHILGLREHSTGFEGLIFSRNASIFSPGILMEPVNMEEIVVYMNKEGHLYE